MTVSVAIRQNKVQNSNEVQIKKTDWKFKKNGFNQAELGIRLKLFYSQRSLFYRFWQILIYFDFFTNLGV